MEPHRPPNKVFPVPYQVDFTVESKGRHLDSTKRKLIWKFGFAHPPSVFPHMYDADGNYRCDGGGGDPDDNPKRGIGTYIYMLSFVMFLLVSSLER